MSQEMETFEARLSSFDTVLHPGKRRGSSAKSVKAIGWPHSRPSPAELAHAGFYYEPHETNPDNTRCFLCESALDGWEEEDNPITEHLTLSQNCGWAIMKDIERHSSNPAEIEDPISERISGARLATFGLYWPHDGKKGWVCQSEKMVAGGWYFCANEESNDLASCAYCKLSLDGWEPKDDPYEEHYRRSSDCSFFMFAQNPNKKTKTSRTKKSRTSKASRHSTQSTASETPTVDIDDQVDESPMPETTSKTKNAKKSKAKAKTTKSKKTDTVDADDQMDVDGTEYADPERPKTKRTTRGKKRTSEDVSQDYGNEVDTETMEQPEPAPKRRATRTRNSTIQQDYSGLNDTIPAVTQDQSEAAPQEEEPKKGRRTKKNTSSKDRKVSEASSTTKAPPTSRTPDDSELDAALEADLEANTPSPEEKRTETTTKQTSKKSKSNKKSKPSSEAQEPADTPDHDEKQGRANEIPEDQIEPVETEPRAQTKLSKSAGKRKAKEPKSQEKDTKSRESPEVDREEAETAVPERHESLVSVEIAKQRPEQLSDAEPQSEEESVEPKKEASTGKSKKSKKPNEWPAQPPEPKEEDERHVEEVRDQEPAQVDTPKPREATPEQESEKEEQPEDQSARRRSSRRSSCRSSGIPPKTVERYNDIPQEKQSARSLTESHTSDTPESMKISHSERQASGSVSPLPSASRGSPSLSPQSSDAENQPPSTKPSASRNFAPSPSKQPSGWVPLGVSTPLPSKRNADAGGLKTSRPWTPIDIERILFARDGAKENPSPGGKSSGNLTSPEKKMTVEEWIFWNAKNGEERLKQECERLVNQFEKEGGRAMRVLEGIECID